MTTQPSAWMLDNLRSVQGVRDVVVLSNDGLASIQTETTSKNLADKLAAGSTGIVSLGRGLAAEVSANPGIKQAMIEFFDGFLFLREIGGGARLAVVTDSRVDAGLVAQQMQALVLSLGERALGTPARS